MVSGKAVALIKGDVSVDKGPAALVTPITSVKLHQRNQARVN